MNPQPVNQWTVTLTILVPRYRVSTNIGNGTTRLQRVVTYKKKCFFFYGEPYASRGTFEMF